MYGNISVPTHVHHVHTYMRAYTQTYVYSWMKKNDIFTNTQAYKRIIKVFKERDFFFQNHDGSQYMARHQQDKEC